MSGTNALGDPRVESPVDKRLGIAIIKIDVGLEPEPEMGDLETELADGRRFQLTPGTSYQVADGAEPHRSSTAVGAKLFIVD